MFINGFLPENHLILDLIRPGFSLFFDELSNKANINLDGLANELSYDHLNMVICLWFLEWPEASQIVVVMDSFT